MEAEDYKTLLKQAEEELGATPGAYCSRKVALRALELLREAGQKEFVEFLAKADVAVTKAQQHTKQMQDTIESQAQAIRRLEEEKTRGGQLGQLGQHREIPMGEGILAKAKANGAYNTLIDSYTDNMRRALNMTLDKGKPWTEY